MHVILMTCTSCTCKKHQWSIHVHAHVHAHVHVPEQSLLHEVVAVLSLLIRDHEVEDPERAGETGCLLPQEVGASATSES